MSDTKLKLWRRVKKFVPLLRFLPGVRLVAVCNNLAFAEVDEGSDIDLFVIVKRGCLFSTRLLMTILFHFLGVRRYGDKVAGRFCLSFFVDDEFLDFSKIAIERDFYLARWIACLKPVVDDGVSGDFWEANRWVDEYFEKVRGRDLSFVCAVPVQWTTFLVPSFVEAFLMKWQLKRARLKKDLVGEGSGLIVEENILKFHNVDRRLYYRDLWLEKYGSGFTLDLL